MDKLIPIFIVVGIIIVGFLMKLVKLGGITERINFTYNYRNKLIELTNGIFSDNNFNQQLYYELTSDVKSMQYELGQDGIVHTIDNLKGFSASNYQLLINFLPELRDYSNDPNGFMGNRCFQLAGACDDMLIRHLGSLENGKKAIKRNMLNPFSCFSEGIKFLVSLPILLLNWLGLMSDEWALKAKHSWIIKFLNFVAIVVGFIGGVVTIIIGWSDFWKIICDVF